MVETIREIINKNNFYDNYFKNHRDDWNILCISMDTIDDTESAIIFFQSDNFDNQDLGLKYLKLYGLLQAVFLQQDAIKFLYQTIKNHFDQQSNMLDFTRHKTTDWKKLRDYRNLSVGHPIGCTSFERTNTKRAFLSQISISSSGFQLLVWDKDQRSDSFLYVDLSSLLESYVKKAKDILLLIEACLKETEFGRSRVTS